MQWFSIYSCKKRTARILYALYVHPEIPDSVPYIGRYTLGELRERIIDEYEKAYDVFAIKESCEELTFSRMLDVYADRTYGPVLYRYRLTNIGRRVVKELLLIADFEEVVAEKLLCTSLSPNVQYF